jgi:uncharacterized membrane protein YqaE (UPF0057 family)
MPSSPEGWHQVVPFGGRGSGGPCSPRSTLLSLWGGAAHRESPRSRIRGVNIVNKLVLILLAILLPPVAVVLKRGVGKDLLINVLLCLLILFPGMVHALWIVSK